ncbi:hypothetical protein [Elizabethkingia anophelis]|uniref:hypothetical protein n=1 Tax=Elizabethkingia anophelis TaxID=1117645 RepID=UPI00320B704E
MEETTEIKDYYTTDGIYYKLYENGNVIRVGKIEEGQKLSTIQKIEFITEEEYKALTEPEEQK